MNFSLTEEQSMLRDSVRRFVAREYGFEARRARLGRLELHSPSVWTTFAEQGWLGAALTEESGGFGGPIEAALVAHELGRGLVLEPYVAVAVLSSQVLSHSAMSEVSSEQLVALIAGECLPILAHQEPDARFLSEVRTCALHDGEGYRLTGNKIQVLGGVAATAFLISARTSGAPDDENGISLFEVTVDAPELKLHQYQLIDGTPVADIQLNGVWVPEAARIGAVGQSYAALDLAFSHATTAMCAQAVGAMERAVEITRDYLKIRKQFGVPIGSFQTLQHRLADMVIHLEEARTMVYRALAYRDATSEQRRHAVAAAKVQVGRSAKYIGAHGIQLHGGIGLTEEYSIGHYFKFLYVAESLFGNTSAHLAALSWLRQHSAPVPVSTG